MQAVSITQQASDEFLQASAEKYNLSQEEIDVIGTPPQEDNFVVADDHPVFAVADGVTLDVDVLAEKEIPYLNPSPSARVAEIFCESAVEFATEIYASFDQPDLERVFAEANERVAEYNKTVDRKELVNNPTGEFAATGVFAVKKGSTVYWASICDSFFAHFDSDMNKKFMSSGSCDPYAVINGEARMVEFLEAGSREVESGDKLFLLTDGFEHYMSHDKFLDLFRNWEGNVKQRVRSISQKLAKEKPDKYGHERTLLAIRV